MVSSKDEPRGLLFDRGKLLPKTSLPLVWIPSLFVLDLYSTENIQKRSRSDVTMGIICV